MVAFLADQTPQDNQENAVILIHILHALGNTKSPLAVEYILPHIHNDEEDVVIAAVSALRFSTGLPTVQRQFLSLLHGSVSDPLVEAVINALQDGYDYNKDMVVDLQLIQSLINVTISLKNNYLQTELKHLLEVVGAPVTVVTNSHHKRELSNWNSSSPDLDIIAPASDRMADVSNYPVHRGYLWSRTLGKDEGDHQIYIQAAAGFFAGVNIENCDFKIMGRAVVRGHVLGRDNEIFDILGRVTHSNGGINGKLYVKFAGQVLLDVDVNPSLSYTSDLPETTLPFLSVSQTFLVYGIPLTLELEAQAIFKGDLDISSSRSTTVGATLTPSVTLTFYASAEVSAEVC